MILKQLKSKPKLIALTLALSSGSALAGPLNTAGMFNVYASGSINYGSVDIEGVVGSAGDITFSNGGDIGQHNNSNESGRANEYSVYSGGDVSLNNFQLYNGGIQADGNVNVQNFGMSNMVNGTNQGFSGDDAHKIVSGGNVYGRNGTVGDVYANGSIDMDSSITTGIKTAGAAFSSSIDYGQVNSDMLAASAAYGSMASTTSYTYGWGGNQLIFTGVDDLNIFDVTAEALTNANGWKFAGTGTIVLNILGNLASNTSLALNGESTQFTGGLAADMVLYNFSTALELDITGSIFGSVLAPLATTYADGSGTLWGSLYTNNLTGIHQINEVAFNGVGASSTPVSTPATLPLLLAGLVGLFWQTRRKRV